MKTILLICAFMLPVSAWATPLTWDFLARHGEGGSITGSFTYESTEAPSAVNVRGLTGNTVYALQSWNFTALLDFGHGAGVGTSFNGAPSVMAWSNELAGNTSEFCLGKCIFSNTLYDRLFITNGQQSLTLLFANADTSALPTTIEDWGILDINNSYYKSVAADGTFQTMAFFRSGGITGLSSPQPVPEPSTLVLLALSLVGLLGWTAIRILISPLTAEYIRVYTRVKGGPAHDTIISGPHSHYPTPGPEAVSR